MPRGQARRKRTAPRDWRPTEPAKSGQRVWPAPNTWAAAVIVLAGAVAYSNSLQGVFIFDDPPSISKNESIRSLWRLDKVLLPVGELDYYRPVLNLSLAVCYSVGGLDVAVYHLFNLGIHLAAALALLGLVRRTLLLFPHDHHLHQAATSLAFVAALLWMLHPLQTESVTYVIQRCEAMFGLFTLLSLYCVVRGATSSRAWYGGAVAACALGMGSKEATAIAPFLILLYDRTFLGRSLRGVFQKRWRLYAALAMTLGILVPSIVASDLGHSPRTTDPVTMWEYARTQFGVVVHYLWLSVWPDALCLDYGWPVAGSMWQVIPPAVVLGVLASAVLWAYCRWPKGAFLGAAFLITLAPSSSIVPIPDLAFEHRMYLPLAPLAVAVVLGIHEGSRRLIAARSSWEPAIRICLCGLVSATALALGTRTYLRNRDYASELRMLEDTFVKAPRNERPRYNLGRVLNNLGHASVEAGNASEAVAQLRRALELDPNHANAHNNLGRALTLLGQFDEAIVHFQKAIAMDPSDAQFHHNLGYALAQVGRLREAIEQGETALTLRKESLGEKHPDYADSLNNLGLMCQTAGDDARAEDLIRQATEIWKEVLGEEHPNYAAGLKNLALIYHSLGDRGRAISVCRQVLELNPGDDQAQYLMGVLIRDQAQGPQAANHGRGTKPVGARATDP